MLRTAVTENGVVRGMAATNARVTVYKGIPFAAPPVGENRWRAPQPAANWDGELLAYTFKNISVQDTPGYGDNIYVKEWSCDREVPIGEDCLYLNIWTPANSLDDKLPVLVWYFGGGYQWGYPYEMEFDGENLAKRGVIVVSVNYRLGVFGFLGHPDLTKEAPEAPTNFGTLDQSYGLKWVYRNIAAFGGDPERITVAGQSAGGASVMNQVCSQSNKGYIKHAIVMSGMIRSPYVEDNFIKPQTLATQEQKGVSFFDFLGVKSLAEARKLDAFYIREKYAEYAKNHPRFAPCVDGKFLTEEPYACMLNKHHLDVEIMSGNTGDEFKVPVPERDRDKVNGETKISGIEYSVKAFFENNTGSKNTYYYRFVCDIPGEDNPGTFHSVDLWFFFESLNKCWRPMVGRHYDLARKMCNYWANFIKTGDPNGVDCDGTQMTDWLPYNNNGHHEMNFTSEGPVATVDDSAATAYLTDLIKKTQI